MEFIKKTQNFFYQLQYCLTIDPEPVLEGKKGLYSLMLKPDVFFKLISDFHIDYPFHFENKIIELKALKDKENINSSDALKIIENYKNQYWLLDTVIMFEPVTNKLKQTLKSDDSEISETELNKELINLQKHLQAKRESIYNDLCNKIQALPPQPKTKADILKEKLSQYGFFELEKVKTLSEQSRVSIIEKIAESGLPYAIAMFDYLQFIPYLEKKHFDSKYKLNREVSKWFDSDKEGRAVKGNISSLLKNTTENKDRYTAYKHKENVIKDYELLK